MSYLCLTRLTGSEDQLIFPQSLHDCTTVAEIKKALALVWPAHETELVADDVTLELDAAMFADKGPVSFVKDEGWLCVRTQLEATTQSVVLSAKVSSKSSDQSPTEADDRQQALERQIASAQLEFEALKTRLDFLRQEGQAVIRQLEAANTQAQLLDHELKKARKKVHDKSIERIQAAIKSENAKAITKAATQQRLQRDAIGRLKAGVVELVRNNNWTHEVALTQKLTNTEQLSSETRRIAQQLLETLQQQQQQDPSYPSAETNSTS